MLDMLDRNRDEVVRDAWVKWLKMPALTPGDEWRNIQRRNDLDEARMLKMKLFRLRVWINDHGKAGGPLADLAKIEERYLTDRIEALTTR